MILSLRFLPPPSFPTNYQAMRPRLGARRRSDGTNFFLRALGRVILQAVLQIILQEARRIWKPKGVWDGFGGLGFTGLGLWGFKG